MDFMAVTARQSPDFRTISDVRKRHLPARGGLFTQVLPLCQQAGLVRLGHVAWDGTKIRANASKQKALRYSRMPTAEPAWAAEVAQWLAQAATSDAHEDTAYGVDRRGDELPEWVTNTQHRVERIRAAQAALEAEAQDKQRTVDPLSPSTWSPCEDSSRCASRPHAAQFHRSGQSHHEGAGRIHPRR